MHSISVQQEAWSVEQGLRKAPECPAAYDNGCLPHDKEIDPSHGEQP